MYLEAIRHLLTQYSSRELLRQFPQIEYQHIRIANETRNIKYSTSIDVYCIYELRHMNTIEQRHWMKRIVNDSLTATSLRRAIRQSKNHSVKVKPNHILREAWLLKRRLHKCNDKEREELLSFIVNK